YPRPFPRQPSDHRNDQQPDFPSRRAPLGIQLACCREGLNPMAPAVEFFRVAAVLRVPLLGMNAAEILSGSLFFLVLLGLAAHAGWRHKKTLELLCKLIPSPSAFLSRLRRLGRRLRVALSAVWRRKQVQRIRIRKD